MTPEAAGFAAAFHVYVDGVASGMDEEQVYQVIKLLYPNCADRVRYAFQDRMQTFCRLYPSGKGKKPTEIDPESGLYLLVHDFYAMLVREESEHPVDPAEIIRVLAE